MTDEIYPSEVVVLKVSNKAYRSHFLFRHYFADFLRLMGEVRFDSAPPNAVRRRPSIMDSAVNWGGGGF